MYNDITFSKNIKVIQMSVTKGLVKWIMISPYDWVEYYAAIKKNGVSLCVLI